ncbi:phage antirepressor KilAC domain-containing protein [Leifsonia xyli]|nr:phage antirepressor KilAC domain-containing protein [Leifsonia xyli]
MTSPGSSRPDVACLLGYRDAYNLTRRLEPSEKGTHQMRTPGGLQPVTLISEPGLYRAVMRSDSAAALDFQMWVLHDVLPSIRRTGSYGAPADDLALPGNYVEALEALLVRERANQALTVENARLVPRAGAWDAIASAVGDYSVGDAAKILSRAGVPTGLQRLFAQLEDIRWVYRGMDGKWRAYAERVEKGFLAEKAQFHHHPATGELVLDAPQVRVTVKGVNKLRQRLHVGALTAVTA